MYICIFHLLIKLEETICQTFFKRAQAVLKKLEPESFLEELEPCQIAPILLNCSVYNSKLKRFCQDNFNCSYLYSYS